MLKTRGETKQIPPDRETFTETDLLNLPELHPPDIMPNGNVGTPTMVFMDYIKQCRLPPSIIKKLGLRFPKTRTSKQYGSVPFNYGGDIVEPCDSSSAELEPILTASGHEIVPEQIKCDSDRNKDEKDTDCNHAETSNNETTNVDTNKKCGSGKKKSWRDGEAKRRMELNIEEKLIGQLDDSEEVRYLS